MEKIVLVTKYLFFDEHDNLISENLEWLDYFHENNILVAILAMEQSIKKMNSLIPKEYKEKVNFLNRKKDNYIIIKDYVKKGNLVSIIGVVDFDAIFAFNCKVPLFYPTFLSESGIKFGDKVINYGLPILSLNDVVDCYYSYGLAQKTYFHWGNDEETYKVLSLNNANTFQKPEYEKRIKELFQTNLKGNINSVDRRVLLVLYFHLIYEIITNPLFENIRYWGHFPSSDSSTQTTSASWLKESVRVMVRGLPLKNAPVFIRHSSRNKKQTRQALKWQDKCDLDFESLCINPELENKLKGKEICIIDDYITTGYSAETAKHLLLQAGASRVIFLSIGKFGKVYMDTKYEIIGNIFSEDYSTKFISENNIQNKYYDEDADFEILKFNEIFD